MSRLFWRLIFFQDVVYIYLKGCRVKGAVMLPVLLHILHTHEIYQIAAQFILQFGFRHRAFQERMAQGKLV